ncbi:hypothetical protein [Candidatus Avelusimicrobium aviculae]|uniref:hypothetical protein n=1 Tax=Candidatus Avelusimicrobium aviculae TaxID=3416206 RepID=UPI003D11515D
MAFDSEFDGQTDFSDFLERFRLQELPPADSAPHQDKFDGKKQLNAANRQAQYNRSFEKLEEKIQELEERFEASSSQNDKILTELARTREAVEKQKDKDAFISGLADTINSLKASVETLSKAQTARVLGYTDTAVNRGFDDKAPAFPSVNAAEISSFEPETYRMQQEEKARREREEKERIISSLHQKASQLKAVNSALDREIKKVQQEKMDALRKSAEQAKEILSLREQLTAAEERFKSFNFDGRIISIKQQYQQKVSSLENQLHEISNVCMKQVEEIESLKAENLKLHAVTKEREELLARYEAKTKELEDLKASLNDLETEYADQSRQQMSVFGERIRTLEEERDDLAAQLATVQEKVEAVLQEKQLLEANFKELLEKINSNDAVIEDLKRKIEVLTAQNAHLSGERDALQTANQDLARQTVSLHENNEALLRDQESLRKANEELSRRTDELNAAKEDLTRQTVSLHENNEALLRNQQSLRSVNEELARKTDELNAANEALQQEQASLTREKEFLTLQKDNWAQERSLLEQQKQTLAQEKDLLLKQKDVLEQEKEKLTDENRRLREGQSSSPVPPAPSSHRPLPPQAPSLVQLHKKPLPVRPAAPKALPINEVPVEVTETFKPKVRSEEDLPEIKVAQPVVQDDFDPGEDFLEKTDSFIGRMKWSIFREDK